MTELRSDAGRPADTEVTCWTNSGQPYMSAKSLRAFQIPESAIACAERTGSPIGSSTSVTATAPATKSRPHPDPERLKRSPGTEAPLAWADGPAPRAGEGEKRAISTNQMLPA